MKRYTEGLYKAYRNQDLWLNVVFIILLNMAAIIFSNYLPFSLKVGVIALAMVNSFHIAGCSVILMLAPVIKRRYNRRWPVVWSLRSLFIITLSLTHVFIRLAERIIN